MTVKLRLNRAMATAAMAALLAMFVNHDYSKWGRMGRAAFLEYQAGRFDRYMGPDHPLSTPIFGLIFVAVFIAAVYEGLSAAFAKILPSPKPGAPS